MTETKRKKRKKKVSKSQKEYLEWIKVRRNIERVYEIEMNMRGYYD